MTDDQADEPEVSAELRAELEELPWEEVTHIAEDPEDDRSGAAAALTMEMVRPIADALRANSAEFDNLFSGIQDLKNFRLPKIDFAGLAVPRTDFSKIEIPDLLIPRIDNALLSIDGDAWASIRNSLRVFRESLDAQTGLAKWSNPVADWSIKGPALEQLVDATRELTIKVEPETAKISESINSQVPGDTLEAKRENLVKSLVWVYLAILADRTVPDRDQLYGYLVALIHLIQSLPR